MRYLDVCAGISASTVAWKPLGWQAAAYSEIEAAPRSVLAHHHPHDLADRAPGEGEGVALNHHRYGGIA